MNWVLHSSRCCPCIHLSTTIPIISRIRMSYMLLNIFTKLLIIESVFILCNPHNSCIFIPFIHTMTKQPKLMSSPLLLLITNTLSANLTDVWVAQMIFPLNFSKIKACPGMMFHIQLGHLLQIVQTEQDGNQFL